MDGERDDVQKVCKIRQNRLTKDKTTIDDFYRFIRFKYLSTVKSRYTFRNKTISLEIKVSILREDFEYVIERGREKDREKNKEKRERED